jgi:hypothetical protein
MWKKLIDVDIPRWDCIDKKLNSSRVSRGFSTLSLLKPTNDKFVKYFLGLLHATRFHKQPPKGAKLHFLIFHFN